MNIGAGDRVAEIAVIDLSKFPDTGPEADTNDGDGDATPSSGAAPNHRGSSGRGRPRRRR
jgi:hypothetical protein